VSKAHPPGLPAGAELFEANLYAVIEMIAGRAFVRPRLAVPGDLHPVRGPRPRRGPPTRRRQDASHRFVAVAMARRSGSRATDVIVSPITLLAESGQSPRPLRACICVGDYSSALAHVWALRSQGNDQALVSG